MKLLQGTVSPFVRKVTVTLHELGLSETVERVPSIVSATQPNPEVVAHNPVGKIPTLITSQGEAIYDSTVICEYLATLAGDTRLFPAAPARWRALRLNALGDGLIQAGILARTEISRAPEMRWEAIYKAQWAKVGSCLQRLEEEAGTMTDQPTIGEITVGCAIGWLDFRVADFDWREDHPRLAVWYEGIRTRRSFQETIPKS